MNSNCTRNEFENNFPIDPVTYEPITNLNNIYS